MLTYLLIIFGLFLLYFGGELLVLGSVSIASKARISKLVVGLTVVSFATSCPELFVSFKALLSGSSDIVFSNVIGSNIANICLVLSITAIIFNINITKKTLKLDYSFLLISTFFVAFFLFFNNKISQIVGIFLLFLLLGFLIFTILKSRKEESESKNELEEAKDISVFKSVFYLISGILLLKFGADFLVDGAIDIAKKFNVSERIIGVTIIAIGTSIPELVTSIVAAFRKEVDLAVGNIIGSNIFNLLLVLGATALLRDITLVDSKIILDYGVMIMVTVFLGILCVLTPKYQLTRYKGLLLLTMYLIYITYSVSLI
jgi:cation:H+ antiporter